MNNDRLRIVFENVNTLLEVDGFRALGAPILLSLKQIALGWMELTSILRKDEDFSVAQCWEFQDKIDDWKLIYLSRFPSSDGCYLHMLFRGHIRDFLLLYKNLHRYANIDSEAHNGQLKNYINHHTQRGGHKGGKYNKELSDEGNQTESSTMALCRYYKRRFMWFLDPDILDKLEIAKRYYGVKKSDVVTTRPGHMYAPQNYVHNTELLKSIYPTYATQYIHAM